MALGIPLTSIHIIPLVFFIAVDSILMGMGYWQVGNHVLVPLGDFNVAIDLIIFSVLFVDLTLW